MLDNFSIDQMSPRLRDFLHLVWDNRNVPELDLYKLYVGGRPHDPSNDYAAACDRPAVILFLEALEHSSNQASIEIRIQAWGSSITDINDARKHASDQGTERWQDVGKSFYHFPKGGAANWRIYLNVPVLHRGVVACFIAEKIVAVLNGVTNAKVLGPAGIGWDTIVIYLADEASVNDTLKIIAEYQQQNATHFNAPTIHLARPAEYEGKKLIGVATACEPAEHAKNLGLQKKPSFGDFWELLLLPILNQTRYQSEEAFLKRVLQQMRILNMDPKNPEM